MTNSCCYNAVKNHLDCHRPELLTSFGGDQSVWLSKFEGDPLARMIFHITDPEKQIIVWSSGTECLGRSTQDWNYPLYIGSIPLLYCKIHRALAQAAYSVYHRHNLIKHGLDIWYEKELPMIDSSGEINICTQQSWILLARPNSVPVLTATRLIPHAVWDKDSAPILMRPRVFIGTERKKSFEDEIVSAAMSNFVDDSGLSKYRDMLPVLADGLSNKEIARTLKLPVTTVNFYNTELLGFAGQNFSTNFETARDFARYLRALGVPF